MCISVCVCNDLYVCLSMQELLQIISDCTEAELCSTVKNLEMDMDRFADDLSFKLAKTALPRPKQLGNYLSLYISELQEQI